MPVATPPTDVSNAELIRWYFEGISNRDLTAISQLWTDQTVERFPDRICRGTAEMTGYFEEVFAAMPDMRIELEALVEQNDQVFARWRLTGTHEGPLLGIAPTGKWLEIDGVDNFILQDGKIATNFVVFDQMQYARQLGMMPADGSTADKALKGAFNARTKLVEKLKQR